MTIEQKNHDLILYHIEDFDLEQTLECGQCFHFVKLAEQEYGLTAYGKLLHIRQQDDNLIFYDTTEKEYQDIWKSYFDLDTDYRMIKQHLLKVNAGLADSIHDMSGVRILNQAFFETLISFIISQNKQIPHIKKIVAQLSQTYGTYLGSIQNQDFYSFPTPEQLSQVTEEELRECKTGFRAPYIVDAVHQICSETINEEELLLADTKECEQLLTKIKGVGVKVANCVMLFSLKKMDAFPVDVWIKRIMEYVYFDGKVTDNKVIAAYAREQFGDYGGYAQQYLFYYGKTNKIGTKGKVG